MGDSDDEVQQRCRNIRNVEPGLIQDLQQMLHGCNKYIRSFKAALEMVSCDEGFRVVIRDNIKPSDGHRGRYNAPTSDEVAILIVGQDFEKRDIILHSRDNKLQRVSEIHRSYDALQYPLLFPLGEDGYGIHIPQYDPEAMEPNFKKTVSAMNFYAYRMMIRVDQTNHLHLFRQLSNQYWVDMFAKVESERLSFIRFNQKKLRVENYCHLKDAINNDGDVNNIGQLVILPSSFIGGPRYMHERTQDAMTYVRKYGRPDLFITFTCNPKWKEIEDELFLGQKPHDRHDIVSRVFNLKLRSLMDLLTKGEIFGSVQCHMYSIEWQKRGLPHAHILLWLQNKLSPNEIDDFISAEIPDAQKDPLLHEIIKCNMIHGPCGPLNKTSSCMQDGKCTKRYPRNFMRQTRTGTDGYPTYRRRAPEDGGLTLEKTIRGTKHIVDNRWVVPFCPVLSRSFNAHINVEFCSSVKSIKYVCKYINKGSDQASFALGKENDEIERYQTGRYISTSEAVWRILGLDIHNRFPTVVHLAVHLENGQRVYFTEENAALKVNEPPRTTLTEFFRLCETDDFARTLYYHEVPTYYTWDDKKFSRRKQGEPCYPGVRKSSALGRVYTVHPNNSECYFLRMLLHKIKGPTSFESLKQGHLTYQAACRALGLLEDDNHWTETLKEAAVSQSPSIMRDLFVIMLAFCQVADPQFLWDNHKDDLTEDILHRLQVQFPHLSIQYNKEIYNEGLISINNKLRMTVGKSLEDYGFPRIEDNHISRDSDYLRESAYNIQELSRFIDENESRLLPEQEVVYKRILDTVNSGLGTLYFLMPLEEQEKRSSQIYFFQKSDLRTD